MKAQARARGRNCGGRGGQALVETALVLPLVLLLLFGIVSYGLYINAVATIQQAVRVGSRTAAIGDTLGCPGDSAATEVAQGHHATVYGAVDDQINHDKPWLNTGSGSQARPVISYAAILGTSTNPQQNYVIITVAYLYHPLIAIPALMPNPIEIAQTYQMMVQTPQPSNGTTSTMPTGSPYDETAQWTQPTPPTTHVTYLTQPGGC